MRKDAGWKEGGKEWVEEGRGVWVRVAGADANRGWRGEKEDGGTEDGERIVELVSAYREGDRCLSWTFTMGLASAKGKLLLSDFHW